METKNKMVDQIKSMIDLITENGYLITVKDFRESLYNSGLVGAKILSNECEILEHLLSEITIYREDSLEKTLDYLQTKVSALAKLLLIKTGTYFEKEATEICEYARSKNLSEAPKPKGFATGEDFIAGRVYKTKSE